MQRPHLERFVVGIDLSLTGTGLAEYSLDMNEFSAATHGTKGKRTDTYAMRGKRLEGMCDTIVDWALSGDYDPLMVVIEGPSLGSKGGSQFDRSGLWWLIVSEFLAQEVPTLIVPPKTRAKYATGNGNSAKDVVYAHAIEQYQDFMSGRRIKNDNEADAIVLAAMGARYLGEPQEEDLPAVNCSAMAGIEALA